MPPLRRACLGALALALGISAARAAAPDGGNKGYRLDRKPVRTVEASYQVTVIAPRLRAREWALFWPKALDHPGQQVISGECQPKGKVVADRSALRQPLWQVPIRVKSGDPQDSVSLTVVTKAELFSRRLVTGVSGAVRPAPVLDANERKLFSRRTSWFDYDAPGFVAWMKAKEMRRGEKEGEIDFARRAFVRMANDFSYEYLAEMKREASVVCRTGKSDCGGLSVVFVAVMRAHGIPARMLAGRWAKSVAKNEKIGEVLYFQEHVKAEFFARGVGWVPVDLSSAVLHDKTPEKLRFFGNDPGDHLILHFDHGLLFDTGFFGVKEMDLLQRASYWAAGDGDFDGAVMKEGWSVSSRAR